MQKQVIVQVAGEGAHRLPASLCAELLEPYRKDGAQVSVTDSLGRTWEPCRALCSDEGDFWMLVEDSEVFPLCSSVPVTLFVLRPDDTVEHVSEVHPVRLVARVQHLRRDFLGSSVKILWR